MFGIVALVAALADISYGVVNNILPWGQEMQE
jgi:hypothetical protein